MPLQNRFNNTLQIKFEISEIDHEIQRMQVDLEYSQKQAMLIRQAIEEKQQRMEQQIRRLEKMQMRETHNDRI